MHTRHADTLRAAQPSTNAPTNPYPLTPPSDERDIGQSGEVEAPCEDLAQNPNDPGVDDNTAAGMSLMQEESMYVSHETPPDEHTMEQQAFAEKEKPTLHEMYVAMTSPEQAQQNQPQRQPPSAAQVENGQPLSSNPICQTDSANATDGVREEAHISEGSNDTFEVSSQQITKPASSSKVLSPKPQPASSSPAILASLPEVLSPENSGETEYGTKPWDFTHVPLSTQYPSSLLHPGSKFEGTQQSDRQIYNVTVTVHTVDIPQAKISGYLKIEGLTPDHPTLTTFFTGEIIGGPDQKYSFQTKHPGWGATDKTDLIHWARFPAWRPFSRDAKRDINFQHPTPGTGLNGNDSWWEQQHIFMRWKEWFLVPDHRVRSIQGASFEGFYYICFDQIEGKISGIYFHARSEKYQQLELKHEGDKGVWNKGIRPAMEFR